MKTRIQKRLLLIAFPLMFLAFDAAYSFELGDPAKGEKVFRKCKACHAVGDGAKTKIGPILNGVVGQSAGTQEGFKYSKALRKAVEQNQLTWTVENLDEFLKKPKAFLPGTKISFAGLRKEKDRQDILAYLATFEEEGGS
jgi:cytochrome c